MQSNHLAVRVLYEVEVWELWVDFSLDVIQDQLIRGFNDTDIVSDLLGDMKVDRTLEEVVEYVARKEQAKSECSTVSVEPVVFAVKQTPNTPQPKHRCRHCKGAFLGVDTKKVRRDSCSAWSHVCEKCRVKDHSCKDCFKCQDCNSWGLKSKQSKWCQKSANPVD